MSWKQDFSKWVTFVCASVGRSSTVHNSNHEQTSVKTLFFQQMLNGDPSMTSWLHNRWRLSVQNVLGAWKQMNDDKRIALAEITPLKKHCVRWYMLMQTYCPVVMHFSKRAALISHCGQDSNTIHSNTCWLINYNMHRCCQTAVSQGTEEVTKNKRKLKNK